MQHDLRHDWELSEIREIHDSPLMDLVYRAATVHRAFHPADELQVCKLISIKTGACPEDCSYCSQSSRYQTGVKPQGLMAVDEVLETAHRAKANGVTRVCMGAAWRQVKDNAQFDHVLDMVRQVTNMGLEVCCTLGMLTESQAKRLEDAGLYAYNHNIDTSEEYYETIITTRTFADRLNTIENVRKTGVSLCCGGIIGMGEAIEDRISMLGTLARMNPHPESVPVNVLSKVAGTPMADKPKVPVWDVIRMIATARIIMPRATVRLSAGRAELSESEQALCFMAGANSFFSSESGHMLTKAVPSPDYDSDHRLLRTLGLQPQEPFKNDRERSCQEACPASV